MKVAVIMGGTSLERKFSLESGKHIAELLERAGHEALPLDADSNLVDTLRAEKPDVAYLAIHGAGGEDGTVASLLEFLRIPYVGSRPPASREAWNKSDLPFVMRRAYGNECVASWPAEVVLPSRAFRDMGAAKALDAIPERVGSGSGFPLAVKPAHGGSAMGLTRVESVDELGPAIMEALSFDDSVLIQEWVDGVELSVPVVDLGDGAQALPAVEVHMKSGLYDTDSREDHDRVEYFCPVRPSSLSNDEAEAQAIRSEVERAAVEVFNAFGCRDLARVDLIWDGARAMVLDLKVSPGMMPSALIPMATEAAGIDLSELLDQLVKLSFERSKAWK